MVLEVSIKTLKVEEKYRLKIRKLFIYNQSNGSQNVIEETQGQSETLLRGLQSSYNI